MPKVTKPASFEDFLEAPTRLAKQRSAHGDDSAEPVSSRTPQHRPAPVAQRSTAPSNKVKVGLTIDSDVLDAIDDYIYHARKQGRRLKKNDVYEAALRQFLGMGGGEGR